MLIGKGHCPFFYVTKSCDFYPLNHSKLQTPLALGESLVMAGTHRSYKSCLVAA